LKLAPPLALHRPPDRAAWDALVTAAPTATIFHTAAWAELWTGEWRDARWEAIVLEEGGRYEGAIGAIVRHRGPVRTVFSMPFSTYGGPLVRADHPDPAAVRRALLEAFGRLAASRLTLRAEITWYGGVRNELPPKLPADETFTHVLPLGRDYESLSAGFAPAARRLVRQSEESGLAIRAAENLEDVRAFYNLAVETVRRRGGTPKPFSLYARIFKALVPAGLARYHLVLHEERPVAGSLHLFREGVATSWLPVSSEAAWPLRPNNFLISRVLMSLCDAGYLEYHFGASPPDAAGLIRFKESWGASPRPVVTAGRRSDLHRRLRG
jgi:CelD/BcsL family acetyltransferase involved in cellulose biosynthesis